MNPFVHAVLTPTGGHVGFIEGMPWTPRFWAEEQAAAFLESRLITGPAQR
jgi:predicted alpha/beta-fold hydrolase